MPFIHSLKACSTTNIHITGIISPMLFLVLYKGIENTQDILETRKPQCEGENIFFCTSKAFISKKYVRCFSV